MAFALGLNSVVWISLHPKNFVNSFHKFEVNCLPLSDVIIRGALHQATKCETNAFKQVLAEMFL